ncbi:MAG: hypothetical protein R2706_01590 [Acidimicrobiales bacterium]
MERDQLTARWIHLRSVLAHVFVGVLCIVGLLFGLLLPGRNPASTMIAMFFVISQLAIVLSFLIGAERSDRTASSSERLEPTTDEAMVLLDDYLSSLPTEVSRELVSL